MDAGTAGELVLRDAERTSDLLDFIREGAYCFANHCVGDITLSRQGLSSADYVVCQVTGKGALLRDFLLMLCPRALVEEARERLHKDHVAKLMGISPGAIDQWRSGKRNPSLDEDRRMKLVEALEEYYRVQHQRTGRLLG